MRNVTRSFTRSALSEVRFLLSLTVEKVVYLASRRPITLIGIDIHEIDKLISISPAHGSKEDKEKINLYKRFGDKGHSTCNIIVEEEILGLDFGEPIYIQSIMHSFAYILYSVRFKNM